MMRNFLNLAVCATVFAMPIQSSFAQDDPKPKDEKPSFGDKDDVVLQNKRFLKISNVTGDKLTVFLQFRTPKDDAWVWVPDSPANSTDALSFEIEAGQEIEVKRNDEPVAASRMRIWANSATQKWLKYKSKDAWLVPEKTEDGEHVYTSPGVETYTFIFSNDKDKGVIAGDSDMVGQQDLPSEGEAIPPPIPEIPWDDVPFPLPPDFPIVRDLAVMPVFTVGSNAMVRVKNLGHFGNNMGRRLFVKRLAPGSLPEDVGPIGPLYHYSVKTFFLIGLKAGDYVAYVTPGDNIPYHINDKRTFTITAASYSDAAVLPVAFAAGKVWLKVKNVGTAPLGVGQHLKTQKLPAGPIVDHGPIGPLGVNSIKAFPGLVMPAGSYRAFVTPGDMPPNSGNDKKFFVVAKKTFVDLDLMPIFPSAGKATMKVKNIGTADAPAGAHLKTQKLPGGPIVDHGPIGALNVGSTKIFLNIPFPAGTYKAFISPGDAPPHHANDSELFNIAAFFDHDILPVSVSAGKATIKVKNIGGLNAPAGARLKTQKLPGGPIVDHGFIGALAPGATRTFLAIPLSPGNYKAFVSPGDAPPHHLNDAQSFVMPAMPDLEAAFVIKVGTHVKAQIKNNGPGAYLMSGGRTWRIEKFFMGAWTPVPIVDPITIPTLAPGASTTVQGSYTGPGNYRLRLTPGDPVPGNDVKTKVLP